MEKQTYHLLKELEPSRKRWKIKVRVSRMWVAANVNNPAEIFGLEMLLIDEKMDQIHAVALGKKNMLKYKEQLEEGKVFYIDDFTVTRVINNFRPIHNPSKILFKGETKVAAMDNDDESIPKFKFEFVEFEDLGKRVGQRIYLTDVIGAVKVVHPIRQHVKPGNHTTHYRELEITNHRQLEATIRLWGTQAEEFDVNSLMESSSNMITITSTLVNQMNGKLNLWSTSGTKLYFNLAVGASEDFTKRVDHDAFKIKILEPDVATPLTPEEMALKDRISISELSSLGLDETKQNEVYTVKATISEIYPEKWCYMCCGSCSIKVEDGETACPSCPEPTNSAVARYRFPIRVEDDTGDTTFVAFGPNAQHLINKPITHLVKLTKKKNGTQLVEDMLEQTVGITHIFQIKITKFSLEENFQSFTVSNIFPVSFDEFSEDTLGQCSSSKRLCTRTNMEAGENKAEPLAIT